MDLREQIRIAIGGALAAQEGNDGAADAVMKVLEKQEPVAWTTRLALELGSSALGFNACRGNLWGDKGIPLYALPGAQAQPAPSGVRKVDRGFRWDSEAQCHIPTLEVEFDPVPAGFPNDAKGWQERDQLAAWLQGMPAQPALPVAEQDQINAEAAIRSIYGARPNDEALWQAIANGMITLAHMAQAVADGTITPAYIMQPAPSVPTALLVAAADLIAQMEIVSRVGFVDTPDDKDSCAAFCVAEGAWLELMGCVESLASALAAAPEVKP